MLQKQVCGCTKTDRTGNADCPVIFIRKELVEIDL